MKIKKYLIILIISLTQLLLVGCGGGFFNHKPVDSYDGVKRDDNNIALIRGQAYMASVGDWIQVHIKEVDGREVYNQVTSLQFPYIVNVVPGMHELTIQGFFGNLAFSHEHEKLPKISANFEAGKAYQILFDVVSEKDKPISHVYHIVPIGTIVQYNEFLIKNPTHKSGYPIPILTKQ